MKLAICGSRYINNPDIVETAIRHYDLANMITEIVSGGASGIDYWAEKWARSNGVPFRVFPANWSKYGKAAGPIRNAQIADNSEALLAIPFRGLQNRGTNNMVKQMKEAKKPVYIFLYSKQL